MKPLCAIGAFVLACLTVAALMAFGGGAILVVVAVVAVVATWVQAHAPTWLASGVSIVGGGLCVIGLIASFTADFYSRCIRYWGAR